MTHPTTLFEKIWNAHAVSVESMTAPATLYVDLHLIHEVTSPQAFTVLAERGLRVRRPDRTLATIDHSIPTLVDKTGSLPILDDAAGQQIQQLRRACTEHGIQICDLGSATRGIVHVIGPELGATRPGMTIVCGDSHTSTHGAFGALAFGIGTSQVGHVLATQCLLMQKPKTMAITVTGALGPCVSAKDIILGIIAQIGVDGATGHVIEYRGSTIESLSMEQRMTVCNMSIEAGARAGMIAPDQTTIDYVEGRPLAPTGADWDRQVQYWNTLRSDPDAAFDAQVTVNAQSLTPMITWGTTPAAAIPISGRVPETLTEPGLVRAAKYMNLKPGQSLLGLPIQTVFIGSCTNSRISDLRAAASVLRHRRVAPGLRVLVVPGSQQIRQQAEQEGLARVFVDAGAEWRESGCSMCIAMNGDRVQAGHYAVSTSNRNFEGRQGAGARTFLASPVTAAACAVTGVITDPRELKAASGSEAA